MDGCLFVCAWNGVFMETELKTNMHAGIAEESVQMPVQIGSV